MRYIIQREPSGEWRVFDVRTQRIVSGGMSLEDAKELQDKKNRENAANLQRDRYLL